MGTCNSATGWRRKFLSPSVNGAGDFCCISNSSPLMFYCSASHSCDCHWPMFVFPPTTTVLLRSSWTFRPKLRAFLLKKYKNMCTGSCKQKSPSKHCLLTNSKLTQFLRAREASEQIFAVALDGPWERERKPHCLEKVFHRLSKKDILRRKSLCELRRCKTISSAVRKHQQEEMKRALRCCCVIRILDDCDTESHTCSLIDHKWLSSPFIARSGVLEHG